MDAPKKLTTAFDPSATPFTAPEAQFTYIEHESGTLMVNSNTLVVTPIPDQPYPGVPIKLPDSLMNVDQPHVFTCGPPRGERGIWRNRGCESAVNGGCAIYNRYGRIGPCNVIVEKHGKVDSLPCHVAYTGVSDSGQPTSQPQYLLKGWRILSDRTTIPERVIDPETRRNRIRYTEVPNLAPFYEEAKAGRFADPPAEPKKRGRPKGSKNANRESLPAA